MEINDATGAGNDSEIIFTAADPLGNIAHLYQEGFKHIADHPEACNQDLIRQSIEDPNVIMVDKEHDKTYNYYKKHNDITLEVYGTYMKVPVDYSSGTWAGRVKTAYFDDNVHQKDKPKWKK
jgi:hypothetical protein